MRIFYSGETPYTAALNCAKRLTEPRKSKFKRYVLSRVVMPLSAFPGGLVSAAYSAMCVPVKFAVMPCKGIWLIAGKKETRRKRREASKTGQAFKDFTWKEIAKDVYRIAAYLLLSVISVPFSLAMPKTHVKVAHAILFWEWIGDRKKKEPAIPRAKTPAPVLGKKKLTSEGPPPAPENGPPPAPANGPPPFNGNMVRSNASGKTIAEELQGIRLNEIALNNVRIKNTSAPNFCTYLEEKLENLEKEIKKIDLSLLNEEIKNLINQLRQKLENRERNASDSITYDNLNDILNILNQLIKTWKEQTPLALVKAKASLQGLKEKKEKSKEEEDIEESLRKGLQKRRKNVGNNKTLIKGPMGRVPTVTVPVPTGADKEKMGSVLQDIISFDKKQLNPTQPNRAETIAPASVDNTAPEEVRETINRFLNRVSQEDTNPANLNIEDDWETDPDYVNHDARIPSILTNSFPENEIDPTSRTEKKSSIASMLKKRRKRKDPDENGSNRVFTN